MKNMADSFRNAGYLEKQIGYTFKVSGVSEAIRHIFHLRSLFRAAGSFRAE